MASFAATVATPMNQITVPCVDGPGGGRERADAVERKVQEGEVLEGSVGDALLVLVLMVSLVVGVKLARHHVHAPVIHGDIVGVPSAACDSAYV
eukprot:CAMPEP_0114266374 /NCGR_PEP_ID=MMETSP0058-20121206/24575_1 /TAXON_ID=36894 /ORGANISM="Pyramimonas parkeae, CCMP726" /LENGTH=93 /DNA_ID=CAMNT_0001383849 /DNA_START=266 /DNA_END=547 /DNA_ORIENTATION=+